MFYNVKFLNCDQNISKNTEHPPPTTTTTSTPTPNFYFEISSMYILHISKKALHHYPRAECAYYGSLLPVTFFQGL